MNSRNVITTVLGTIVGLVHIAPATSQQTSCEPKPVWIVYVNGIQNSPEQAHVGENALEKAHSPTVLAGEPTQYALLYNPSGTLARDIFESAYQSLPQYGVANLTQLFEAIFGLRPASDALRALIFSAAEGVAGLTNVSAEANAIAAAHKYAYEAILTGETGQGLSGPAAGIVVVAHSQGNLFANRAYALLAPPERARMRVVSVATPDDHVAGGGPHFTALEDVFAQLFLLARNRVGLEVLEVNTSLGWPLTQLGISNTLGHGFESAYLLAAPRWGILSAVENARQSIGYEVPEDCGVTDVDDGATRQVYLYANPGPTCLYGSERCVWTGSPDRFLGIVNSTGATAPLSGKMYAYATMYDEVQNREVLIPNENGIGYQVTTQEIASARASFSSASSSGSVSQGTQLRLSVQGAVEGDPPTFEDFYITCIGTCTGFYRDPASEASSSGLVRRRFEVLTAGNYELRFRASAQVQGPFSLTSECSGTVSVRLARLVNGVYSSNVASAERSPISRLTTDPCWASSQTSDTVRIGPLAAGSYEFSLGIGPGENGAGTLRLVKRGEGLSGVQIVGEAELLLTN